MMCFKKCHYIPLALIALAFTLAGQGQRNSIFEYYNHIENQEFPSSDRYSLFYQDNNGFIWGADSNSKLIRYDGFEVETFHRNPLDSFSHSGCSFWGYTARFLEDMEGHLWILSSESCLERYDPATERFVQFKERLQQLAGEKNSKTL